MDMSVPNTIENENGWKKLEAELTNQMDRSRQQLREIDMLLNQSQVEVNKLAQRNAAITNHLQQVQAQFDSIPRADLRMAYDSALDAQQRLFVMRGQIEKLQSDQTHLKDHTQVLEKVLAALENGFPAEDGKKQNAADMVETVELIIQAQEGERLRLSRQMHDGPAQALSNFILQTEIAMRLFEVDQTKAKEELSTMKISAASTFQKVRDFIFELRPMMLDDLGLTPTLKRYVGIFKEQSGVDVRLMVTGEERRLESYQEVMIFRAVQELLSNVARHSGASQAEVKLDMDQARVQVSVDDNGKGFNPQEVPERGSMGLKVIRDRVEMLGGSFDLVSEVGQGTHVSFQIPIFTTSIEI